MGEPMPGFRLPLLDGGGERSLGDYLVDKRGALVVFWSGSCAHCVRYDSWFNTFVERFRELRRHRIPCQRDARTDALGRP
jgi:hypothetical protein